MRFTALAFLLGVLIAIGPGRALAGTRPIGIDTSAHQAIGLDWSTVAAAGVSFGWTKSTQGTYFVDGNFTTYMANAKANHIYLGAYHFADYNNELGTSGAISEANYFWNHSSAYLTPGYFMPMLDIEFALTNNTKTSLSIWINQWCNSITNAAFSNSYYLKPFIYTSSSFGAANMDTTVTNWYLDVANWPYAHATAAASAEAASGPSGTSPWPSWTVWQYDDQNVDQSVTTGDGDIFNGTTNQMTNTMLITQLGPLYSSTPVSLTVPAGTNVSFSASATGSGTVTYQWKLNGTNINGATLNSLALTNVQATNGGIYTIAAKDSTTVVNNASAVLNVRPPLTNAVASVGDPAGMVAWWPADGNLLDLVGTNNGNPVGGLTFNSPGEVGESLHFDGSTAYMQLTNFTGLTTPWTVCMWVNRQNGAALSTGLLCDGTNSIKLEQYVSGSNSRKLGVTKFGVVDSVFSGNYIAPAGTWVHLAFVCNGTNTTAYANGVSEGTVTNIFTLPRLYVGCDFISTANPQFLDFMAGNLDEIMVFNKALTSAQISAIASAGNAGVVKAPRIASWGTNASHQFFFNLQGLIGKNYTLYSSTNLPFWNTVGTIGNGPGSNSFTDVQTTNNTMKFYKVSQPF